MFSKLKNLFSKKSVDSIVADLVQKVEHLRAVAEASAELARLHEMAIREKRIAATFLYAEEQRAHEIAAKIKALVS